MNVKKNKYFILLIITFLFSITAALLVQFAKGQVITLATDKDSLVFRMLLVLLALIVFELLTYLITGILKAKFVASEKKNLEEKLSKSALMNDGISLDYFTKYVSIIENAYLNVIGDYIYSIMRVVIMSFGLIYVGLVPFVIAITFLTIPIYLPKLFSKKLNRLQEEKLAKYNKALEKFTEITNKLNLIKFSTFKWRYLDETNVAIGESAVSDEKFNVFNAYIRMISSFASYISHFTIIVYGVYNVMNNNMSIGTVIILLGLIEQLSYPIFSISIIRQSIISTKSTREKLDNFINQSEYTEKEVIQDIRTIKLENVSYTVQDKTILNNMSVSFKENKMYLISGDSDTGKTSLIETLLGLNRCTGNIYYNETNIKDVNTFDSVAYINSKEMVVCNSIQFNAELSEVEMKEFSIPHTNNACDLSHGEQKRLSVLKGVNDKRSVIIFDEPFSNMQSELQNQLMNEIVKIKNKIVIVVSHDLLNRKDEFDEVIEL